MKIITQNYENDKNVSSSITNLLKKYKVSSILQTKATSVMLDLIDAAQKAKIPASYVLFDTWFCSPSG